MKIRLERIVSDPELGTTGIIFVDGAWAGFTLEDEPRAEKIDGETRIPAGTYEIKIRADGGMHKRYTEKFGDRHRGMLHLQDVPGFTFVYIHIGNTTDHTDGCLLVGYGAMAVPGKPPKVLASTDCYHAIAKQVYDAIDAGEAVFIEIVNRDLK